MRLRCPSCRKYDVELTTWWERLKYSVMMRWFAEEITDYGQDRNLQGFGDGYKIGWQHAIETKNLDYVQEAEKFIQKENKKSVQ